MLTGARYTEFSNGRLGERLMPAVLRTATLSRVSRVRPPYLPPIQTAMHRVPAPMQSLTRTCLEDTMQARTIVLTTEESDWIEFEIVRIEKHSVWQCDRPCSRTYRHRREHNKLMPAICPMCGHTMTRVDGYWQYIPTTERHHIPNG